MELKCKKQLTWSDFIQFRIEQKKHVSSEKTDFV